MLYQPPFGSTDPNASYVDRSTTGATRGSVPPAAALEDPQREIVDAILKSGITPADTLQLARAMRSQAMNYFTAGGTANALTITPSPAFAALADLVGVPLRIRSAAANTGAMTLAVNGLAAVAVTREGGSALSSGDWPSGVIRTVIYDGTAFRIQAPVTGEFGVTGAPASRWTRLTNGLLMQWGGVTTNSSGATTVTFPVSFTTAVQSIVVTDQSAPVVPSQGCVILTGSVTLTGFDVVATRDFVNAVTDGGFYIAMGY